MKGVIAVCLAELVKNKFGIDKWNEALEKAGLDKHTAFRISQNIDDRMVMQVIKAVCEVLGITLQQAADAFGDYWVNDYAPKIYKAFFRKAKTAKEMLLKMDDVHDMVTKTISNALPPRFTYEWKNDRTLIMNYKSKRGLIDFLVGLIRGVGRYFNEDIKVRKLNTLQVEVVFSY